MLFYQLARQAERDIIAIRRYTMKYWGKDQSTRYIKRMQTTFEMLSKTPLIGQSCEADLGFMVYRYLFERHTIYYLAVPSPILIIAVLHQSMLPEIHLKEPSNNR